MTSTLSDVTSLLVTTDRAALDSEVNPLFCSILVIVGVTTVIENSFVFFNLVLLVVKRRIVRKFLCGYYLFINLTVADFFVGAAALIESSFRLSPYQVKSSTDQCFLRVCLLMTPSIASVLTMTIFSIDRYIAIMHPFKYDVIVTPRKTFAVMLFIWIFSITLGWTPYYNHGESKAEEICSFFIVKPEYVVFTCCGLFVPELFTSCLLYYQIFKVSRQHFERSSWRQNQRNSQAARRFSDSLIKPPPNLTSKLAASSSNFPRVRSHSLNLPRNSNHYLRSDTNSGMTRRISKSVRYPRPLEMTSSGLADANGIAASGRGRKNKRKLSKLSLMASSHVLGKRLQATFENLNKKKSLKTITLILFFFMIMWSPFLVSSVIQVFTGSLNEDVISTYLLLLGISNSALNPLIYTYTNQFLKNYMKKILNPHRMLPRICGRDKSNAATKSVRFDESKTTSLSTV